MLPEPRYRHAFEPGCSVGVSDRVVTERCTRVTATDVAAAALRVRNAAGRCRSRRSGDARRRSLDEPWPPVRSTSWCSPKSATTCRRDALRGLLDRECPRLASGATVVAAHWRHPVDDYLMSGDQVNEVVAATTGLHLIGGSATPTSPSTCSTPPTAGRSPPRTGVPIGKGVVVVHKGEGSCSGSALRRGRSRRRRCRSAPRPSPLGLVPDVKPSPVRRMKPRSNPSPHTCTSGSPLPCCPEAGHRVPLARLTGAAAPATSPWLRASCQCSTATGRRAVLL